LFHPYFRLPIILCIGKPVGEQSYHLLPIGINVMAVWQQFGSETGLPSRQADLRALINERGESAERQFNCPFPNGGARRWRGIRSLRRAGLGCGGRHLQYGSALARAQPRHQDDLAIWKFQGIVMHARLVEVDLAETGDSLTKPATSQNAQRRLAFNVAIESQFCAGQ
jgi:hypothetical protein